MNRTLMHELTSKRQGAAWEACQKSLVSQEIENLPPPDLTTVTNETHLVSQIAEKMLRRRRVLKQSVPIATRGQQEP